MILVMTGPFCSADFQPENSELKVYCFQYITLPLEHPGADKPVYDSHSERADSGDPCQCAKVGKLFACTQLEAVVGVLGFRSAADVTEEVG